MSSFLLEVISCSQDEKGIPLSPAIRRVKEHISEYLDRDISVDEMAEIKELSTHWFKEKFMKETGLSPADFVSRRKIEEAKNHLLLAEKFITDIAFSLGFSFSQYSGVFKRYAEITPTDYREKKSRNTN